MNLFAIIIHYKLYYKYYLSCYYGPLLILTIQLHFGKYIISGSDTGIGPYLRTSQTIGNGAA